MQYSLAISPCSHDFLVCHCVFITIAGLQQFNFSTLLILKIQLLYCGMLLHKQIGRYLGNCSDCCHDNCQGDIFYNSLHPLPFCDVHDLKSFNSSSISKTVFSFSYVNSNFRVGLKCKWYNKMKHAM